MAKRKIGSPYEHKAKRIRTVSNVSEFARTLSKPESLEKAVCDYIKRWEAKKSEGFDRAHLHGPDFEQLLKPKGKGSQRQLMEELIAMSSLTKYEYKDEKGCVQVAFKLKEEEEEETDPFEEAYGLLETVSAVMHEIRDEVHPTSVKNTLW